MKKTIGLIEKATLIGKKKRITKWAKFDTGAKTSSIDIKLAARSSIGPIVSYSRIRSASNHSLRVRPVAEAVFKIKGKKLKANVNLEDRSKMKYKVLIGRDIIHSNFIVDVEKKIKK